MSTARVGDYGAPIRITFQEDGVDLDISTATTKQIIIMDPEGTVSTKTASFVADGQDGEIEWTITSGFLDTAGEWYVQGYVTDGSSFAYKTTRGIITVQAVLA